MDRSEMIRLFEAHREAEAARDIDAILETFAEECFLETMPLGLRSEGKDAVRAAYEMQFFSAFPDLAPDDEGMAYAEDAIAVWGTLRGTSRGEWLGVPPGGGPFSGSFANIVPFRDGLRRASSSTSTSRHCANKLASLCKRFVPRPLHVATIPDQVCLPRSITASDRRARAGASLRHLSRGRGRRRTSRCETTRSQRTRRPG